MSYNPITKRVLWKSGFFWFGLITAIYLLIVRIEETAYHNFINSEWPAHTIKYTQENSPLVGEYITNLTTDNKGRVWIGTDYALNVVEPDGSWIIYTRTPEGLWITSTEDVKGVIIQSLAVDKLERTWVGTFDGIYVLHPNGQWITSDEKSKTVYEHYTSSAILIDRFDRIWVANNDGLRMFLPDGTKQFYTKENSGLPDDYITALAEDRHGNIWIGTRTQGVVVYDQNGQWRTYQADGTENGLVDNWVTTILIDDQDRVWIGTERHGVSMLSPDGHWTTYNVPSWGMQSDLNYDDKEINAFAMDEQGRLWIGTSDALFALEADGNWIAYTQSNSSLRPDYVKALTVDRSERLWIATFHELFVLDLRKPLPKTVPDDRRGLRAKLLMPIQILTNVGEWLFAPAMNFMYVSLYFCSTIYMALLLMIICATIGTLWSGRQKNQKLWNASLWTLVLSIIGVIILWFFSYLVLMIPT
jgi:ligand-binding sensor domain-containing protein